VEPGAAAPTSAVEPDARHATVRLRVAIVALVSGVLATLLPAGVTGGAYVQREIAWEQRMSDRWIVRSSEVERLDFRDLVRSEPAWAVVLASFVVLPLWFWFWRRSAMYGGRALGVGWSLAAAGGVYGLAQFVAGDAVRGVPSGLFWSHVAAGLCFAAAFAAAPRPRS
jgi:hypothetical protein